MDLLADRFGGHATPETDGSDDERTALSLAADAAENPRTVALLTGADWGTPSSAIPAERRWYSVTVSRTPGASARCSTRSAARRALE